MNIRWNQNLRLIPILAILLSPIGAYASLETQKTVSIDLITAEELKSKVTANDPVVILDVRGSESYANSTSRIKGAIHVNVRKLRYRLDFAPLKDIPRDRQLVTYCACPSDEASIHAAQILQEGGFKNVKVLKGGWSEWQKARGPVEQKPRG
jgi:rhodanese-related sulfurtransferase